MGGRDSIIKVAGACLAVLGFAACSSGGGGGNENLSLLADNESVVTTPGNSGNVSFAIAQSSENVGAVDLAVVDVPAGFTASIAPTRLVRGNAVLTYEVGSGVIDGSYDILVEAKTATDTVTRRVTVTTVPSSSASGLELDLAPAMSLRRGNDTATLIEIDRDDGVTGAINLSATGAPSGMTVSFVQPTTQTNSGILRVFTDPTVAAGTYAIQVDATAGSSASARSNALITIVETTATPDIWINRIEFAQSYFSNHLTMVSGKQALVRAHILTDGSAVSSPAVEVIVRNDGIEVGRRVMSGPSLVPGAESPASIGLSYTAQMPQAWINDGLSVEVVLDPDDLLADDRVPSNDTKTVNVDVVDGPEINLVVVPLIVGGRTAIPADYLDDMIKRWPLRSINITTRAPYTVTSVSDVSSNGDGWNPVLSELAALRASDGSSAYYYGAIDLTYSSGVFGLGFVGFPASIGADFSISTMLHELGHNFNLEHAPCGGAQGADADYPHTGGICGTYGYDMTDGDIFDPDATNDLMGYCGSRWISGYNYDLVRDRLVAQAFVQPMLAQAIQTPEPLVSISGWITDAGAVTFGDTRRRIGIAPRLETEEGCHSLQAAFGDGSVTSVPIQACGIGCGTPDPRGNYFSVTIPDRGGLHAIGVYNGDRRMLARRDDNFDAMAYDPGITVDEDGGILSLTWNDSTFPTVSAVHVGINGARTTLALDLRGGSATLDTSALPYGGSFEFSATHDLAGRCVCVAR